MRKLLLAVHVLITLAFTFLPILLSWWLIIVIYALWYAHLFIFGGCILSIAEYGKDNRKEFGTELLKRLGIHMTHEHYRFFSRYLQAPLCLVLALIWQVGLDIKPLLV